MDALLELDTEVEGDGTFAALVSINHRWLGRYARLHPSFSVEPALLERNSLWMNAFFQKSRMTTAAASPQAKILIKKHRETVMERLHSAPLPHSESPFSTSVVDPMAALMFACSIDRCPHDNLEDLLAEAWELLQCAPIRTHALQSGFASCIFRFLATFTETQKRIPCLRLLVLLAEEDSSAVVNACKVAAQGQFWQPNMFVFSLQKRHKDNSMLCELAVRLLECFSSEMPISPPVVLDQSNGEDKEMFARFSGETSPFKVLTAQLSPLRISDNSTALPPLTGGHRRQSPLRPLFSPPTTISNLYREAPSPYSPTTKLPITRPPTSPVEQRRRAKIFSMPKLAAVEGQRQYRCNTPNAPPSRFERSIDVEASHTPDSLFASPPQSPSGSSPTKPRVVSQKYSWDPECINSVSGFEWWWRSLPPNHASLEPTQQLKMVTKAAVRLHSKGELQRAIELYLLALSSETNDEVKFRLRINLACAYEAAENVQSSIDQFRLALELNPNDPYAIYKLGTVLTSAGSFEEARMHFESILDEYPQATDGLKNLEKATEAQKQREDAQKAAIAAAKQRRSPLKSVSPRIYITTPREPFAPSTPVVQPPAPRRKKTPTAKREHPVPTAESNDTSNTPAADTPAHFVLPQQPETTTVATSTDEYLLSPSLLETLVRRCQEARIDMLEAMKRLDPQQRGLVHKESFIGLLRIIAGVNMAQVDDDATRVALNISPNDWVPDEGLTFLKYRGFLDAYTDQHQVESAHLPSDEFLQIKLIDDLIRQDMANISNRNVTEWVRLGSERAVTELHTKVSLCDNDVVATATREQRELRSDTGGTKSAPELQTTEFTPRTRARKDRAREEWLLTAEKARILARRQQHCIKSLRDIAARARAHINCRRDAVAFLLVVAQNAQEQLRARKLRCSTARQDEAAAETRTKRNDETQGETQTNHDDDSAGSTDVPPQMEPESNESSDKLHLNAVKGISEKIYDASVRIAMARLCRNTELDDVKTVAGRFAAFCQVPSFFLDVQARVSDESETSDFTEVAMTAG